MPSAEPSTPPPETISLSIRGGNDKARSHLTAPLQNSGSLDSYEAFDSTTTVGREIPGLQISKLLSSPDSDTLIRDLAITSTSLIKYS